MAIDAGIYNALLGPVRSAGDWADVYADREDKRAQRETQRTMNALQLQQAQQAMQDDNALRQYLGGGVDLSTPQGQAGLYKAAPKAASGILKDRAMLAKEEAQTAQARAATENQTFELGRKKIGFAYQALNSARSPQEAAAEIQRAQAGGLLSPQEAQSTLAELQQLGTPQAFEAWRQQSIARIQPIKDQMEQEWKRREFQLRAGNELIGPDGAVNQTLVGLKQGIAKAGASNVSINTGQKGLDNEFKLRGEFKGEPVYKAHQEMQSAYSQIKQSLAQGTPASDLAAATKIMKLLDPGSVVRESELGMAMAATGLLDRASNYAQNIVSGNKLTPQQRKEFGALAEALYGESVKQFNAKRSEYEKLGGEYGLNAGRALGPNAAAGGGVVDFGSLK